jgi:hypothetical protein
MPKITIPSGKATFSDKGDVVGNWLKSRVSADNKTEQSVFARESVAVAALDALKL